MLPAVSPPSMTITEPVKYAASRIGLCAPDTRLPLAPLSEASKKLVDAALARVGLVQARAAE